MSLNKSLNPMLDDVFAVQIDRRTADHPRTQYDILQQGAQSAFTVDYLEGTTIWKGIVLKVVEQDEDVAGLREILGERSTINAAKFYRLRVRIPELHAHIPEPCGVGSSDASNRAKIEMHPLFVSGPSTLQEPRVGDIVRVSFTKGPLNGIQAGGIYHDVFRRGVGGESNSIAQCDALLQAFEQRERVNSLDEIPHFDPTVTQDQIETIRQITEYYRVANSTKANPTQTGIQWVTALVQVANDIGTNPWWLAALINKESSWNPRAHGDRGPGPPPDYANRPDCRWDPANPELRCRTNASGFIQIIDTTAREMTRLNVLGPGIEITTAGIRAMDPADQLKGPVRAYFKPPMPKTTDPYTQFQTLVMHVFLPALQTSPPTTRFSTQVIAANQNRFETVGDYVSWVGENLPSDFGGTGPAVAVKAEIANDAEPSGGAPIETTTAPAGGAVPMGPDDY